MRKKLFDFKREKPVFLGRPPVETAIVQQMFSKLMDPEWVAEFNRRKLEKAKKPAV